MQCKLKQSIMFLLLFSVTLNAQPLKSVEGIYLASNEIIGFDIGYYQVFADENNNAIISDIYGQQPLTTNFEDGIAAVDEAGNISIFNNNGVVSRALKRVYSTTPDFPLIVDQNFMANPLFEGDWNIQERSREAVTGEILPFNDGSDIFVDVFTLSALGPSLRFNDSNNIYFQGVMINGTDVVFRLIQNPNVPSPIGDYVSFDDNAANFDRDIIGTGHFYDINHFEVLLALQGWDGSGHFLLTIEGQRVNPLAQGDVNGDGQVNDVDRQQIKQLMGLSYTEPSYNLAADLDTNQHIDLRDLMIFDGGSNSDKNFEPGMSGLWFSPERNGEGWDIQMLSESAAFVTWYTYDLNGQQMWLSGLGEVKDGEISVSELNVATKGTVFGENFDPDAIVFENWGSARFYFSSCQVGGISYNGPAEFGNGGGAIQRLTTISGTGCEGVKLAPNNAARFTGIWFDPSQNGAGWLIEGLADNRAVITWYTYDTEGQLMWLVGSGTVENNVLSVPELLMTEGGVFGDEFDPSEVVNTVWGSVEIELNNCNQGELSYQSLQNGFGIGQLNSVRLASIQGIGCED